ncbi:MAG TPA: WbqC family protein [Vicinamibacterales bacterium]|nr:WbqC family protein [Vicinamibacterales bacterium]
MTDARAPLSVGIMQPYLLPYIGYWQLMAAVDRFVIYDNIKYTKKGWINRNRFLRNGEDAYFTLPLKKGADHLDIVQREIAAEFDAAEWLRPLTEAYRKAPCFDQVLPVLQQIVQSSSRNLFEFLHQSLVLTARYLGITTPIVISSTLPIDHQLKAEARVLALCEAEGATRYINPIGAKAAGLYSPDAFSARGLELKYLQTRPIVYAQFDRPFVPWLSILDVMMFNPPATIRQMLDEYDLV